MFINKLLISLIITFFVFTKFVVADELEDRVKELEAKIEQMENKGGGSAEGSSGSTKSMEMNSTLPLNSIKRKI